MPALINGSPTHALIVHFVVVLLPMSIIAALVLVFVGSSRRAFGLVSVLVALVACLAIPLAFLSGGQLRERVAPSPLIDRHVAAAHQLLVVAAVFGVALAVFVALDMLRRARRGELNVVESRVLDRYPKLGAQSPSHTLRLASQISAGVLVVLSLVTIVSVVRVGDSGAKAAWHGRLSAPGSFGR